MVVSTAIVGYGCKRCMMPITVKRLLRESRNPEQPPLRVPAGRAQRAELEAIKGQVEGDGTSTDLSRWDKRDVLRLEPRVPGSRDHGYGYWHSLHVFFTGDELWIGSAHDEGAVPCAGIDQIERTLAAMRERLTDEARRAQKSEKLRKLKVRAIETQIEALARRLGFAYATRAMHTKIKLYIELDAKESIAVDVPHGRFQAVLAELPALIDLVRDIHARGFRYSITPRDRFHSYRRPDPA